MWMADEQSNIETFGMTVVEGQIVTRVDQRQPRPSGLFSSPEPDMWMFRVQDRATGKVVPVRFEGPISAMLDQGDVVHVEGYVEGGVLNARKITDENGALLAKSRCFVATAVYGDVMAPEVEALRLFRRRVLDTSPLGRAFVNYYWRVGPSLAERVQQHPGLRKALRVLVFGPLCWSIARLLRHAITGKDYRVGQPQRRDNHD